MNELRDQITREAEVRIDSELNGTDTRRTWNMTVRFKSFSGSARKYGELSPLGLAEMCDAAVSGLMESIRATHVLTERLLAQNREE